MANTRGNHVLVLNAWTHVNSWSSALVNIDDVDRDSSCSCCLTLKCDFITLLKLLTLNLRTTNTRTKHGPTTRQFYPAFIFLTEPCSVGRLRLFFKIFFVLKYIKIIFFYFLKIIFDISTLKWSKNIKKNSFKIKKKLNFSQT